MSREDFSFSSPEVSGRKLLEIACFRWPASSKAIGVLQISHGMGEHSLRYADVAGFLSRAGFHVYANDHRGHGRTAISREMLGDFGTRGWDGVVEDMATLTRRIRDREAGLPVILMGHSMGSFATQQYLLEYSDLIDAAILSGSASVDKLVGEPSGDADLTALNQAFEPARTPFDWLSRDNAEVDKYIADPLCGFGVNAQSMATMAASARRLSDPAEIACIRKNLPMYIFAGDKDPVNHDLEWLKPVAERYRAAGIKDVSEKYYLDGRHEMLNETNRPEVYRDLLAWMRRAIGA